MSSAFLAVFLACPATKTEGFCDVTAFAISSIPVATAMKPLSASSVCDILVLPDGRRTTVRRCPLAAAALIYISCRIPRDDVYMCGGVLILLTARGCAWPACAKRTDATTACSERRQRKPPVIFAHAAVTIATNK